MASMSVDAVQDARRATISIVQRLTDVALAGGVTRMRLRMNRLLPCAGLAVLLGMACDCDTAVLNNCKAACEDGKNAILLDGLGPDGERFDVDDEETICDKPAVLAAWSCSECRLAFEQEYRLVSEDMVCTCPEDGDVIFNFNEDCSVDAVEPTFEACLEHDSSAQKEQARSCFE